MSHQRLSSHWTLFYKLLLPALWLGGFTATAVATLVVPAWAARDLTAARWIFVLAVPAGFLLFRATCFPLKKVALGPRSFVISNYRHEVEVLFADVERVSGSRMRNPPVVQLDLRRDSGFGRRIVFMPRLRLSFGTGPHPMARELQEILARARG